MKNANGNSAASVRLSPKSSMISGMSGPMIFVRNEMTKNVKRIRPTRA